MQSVYSRFARALEAMLGADVRGIMIVELLRLPLERADTLQTSADEDVVQISLHCIVGYMLWSL